MTRGNVRLTSVYRLFNTRLSRAKLSIAVMRPANNTRNLKFACASRMTTRARRIGAAITGAAGFSFAGGGSPGEGIPMPRLRMDRIDVESQARNETDPTYRLLRAAKAKGSARATKILANRLSTATTNGRRTTRPIGDGKTAPGRLQRTGTRASDVALARRR